jgi:hypothetical protein
MLNAKECKIQTDLVRFLEEENPNVINIVNSELDQIEHEIKQKISIGEYSLDHKYMIKKYSPHLKDAVIRCLYNTLYNAGFYYSTHSINDDKLVISIYWK